MCTFKFIIVNVLLRPCRLLGCQDLLEDVPGRSRREKDSSSSPGDLRSFVKGVTGRSSSKSYSVKDETSSKLHFTFVAFKMYGAIVFANIYIKTILVDSETPQIRIIGLVDHFTL